MTLSQKPSALWNVPYERNKFFTERNNELAVLYQELRLRNAVALSHPRAITGLGGIGKTQLALEYTYRYGSTYTAVFWVRAASSSEIISSFMEVAQMLDLPERYEQDQTIVIEAVLRWLRLHPSWLLVFDNMDDPSIAEPFLPKAGSGHLLLTTRAHALSNIAECIEVEQMRPEIGALLLLRRAEILALQAILEHAEKDTLTIACAISNEIGGLPLALDHAGAYIKAEACSLRDYLTLYQTRRQNLLPRENLNRDYPASVATTWSLSFEKVSQAQPAAAEFLNFCAFLAPDAIPETILTKGAPHLGNVLSPITSDPHSLSLVFKEVLKYSLVQRWGDEGTFAIHRLVQAVVRDSMPIEIQQQWMQRAIQAIVAAYSNAGKGHLAQQVIRALEQGGDGPTFFDIHGIAEGTYRAEYERLLPHILQCAAWIEHGQLSNSRQVAYVLDQAGLYLDRRGRYAEAESLLQYALEIREERLGKTHPATADSLHHLAKLSVRRGEYAQAELLYQRGLKIYEEQFGATDPDTATCRSNLAEIYILQGKYAQAEPLLQQTLPVFQQLGGIDPDSATHLNNLAVLYWNQGKYAQAELLYQRALTIYEKRLGATHPYTAQSLNNLGALYSKQGKYAQAETLLRRALEIREEQLGETHPHTAQSLGNLAVLYKAQGKYAEAERLYQRALEIRKKQLGETHPDTASNLNNLAMLYMQQGKYAQAEPLFQRALSIQEQQLGPDHPDTATGLNNLAMLYMQQGKYAQAETLFQRALKIREEQLGPDHPDTVNGFNNLAALYMQQGKYAEVKLLLRHALVICEQQLGAAHPLTQNIWQAYIGLSNGDTIEK